MKITSRSKKSEDLIAAAHAYFSQAVKPLLKSRFPEVHSTVTAIVSSSVAYGMADELSDLDLFLLLREEDYDVYRKDLESSLKGVESKLSPELRQMCDRGARSQVVTFKMCGVDQFKPGGGGDWSKVDENLMFWAKHAIVLHDPCENMVKYKSEGFYMPEEHRLERLAQQANYYLRNKSEITKALLRQDRLGTLLYMFKSMKGLANIAYISESEFIPHPKWIFPLSGKISGIGNSLQEAADRLAARESTAEAEEILLSLEDRLGQHLASKGLNPRLLTEPDFSTRLGSLRPYAVKQQRETAPCAEIRNFLDACGLGYLGVIKCGSSVAGTGDMFSDSNLYVICRDEPTKAIRFDFHNSFLNSGATLKSASEIAIDENPIDYNWYMSQPDEALYALSHCKVIDDPTGKLSRHRQDSSSMPEEVQHKRIMFDSFVIFRKIRIMNKMLKRGHNFGAEWYYCQTLDQIYKAVCHLDNSYAAKSRTFPIGGLQSELSHKISPLFESALASKLWDSKDDVIRKSFGTSSRNLRLDLAVGMYAMLREDIAAKKLLTNDEHASPLDTQFDIKYWLFENISHV